LEGWPKLSRTVCANCASIKSEDVTQPLVQHLARRGPDDLMRPKARQRLHQRYSSRDEKFGVPDADWQESQ
jgi:hypothetical protein